MCDPGEAYDLLSPLFLCSQMGMKRVPGASHFTFLCLSFLIEKLEMILTFHRAVGKMKYIQGLGLCLASRKCRAGAIQCRHHTVTLFSVRCRARGSKLVSTALVCLLPPRTGFPPPTPRLTGGSTHRGPEEIRGRIQKWKSSLQTARQLDSQPLAWPWSPWWLPLGVKSC